MYSYNAFNPFWVGNPGSGMGRSRMEQSSSGFESYGEGSTNAGYSRSHAAGVPTQRDYTTYASSYGGADRLSGGGEYEGAGSYGGGAYSGGAYGGGGGYDDSAYGNSSYSSGNYGGSYGNSGSAYGAESESPYGYREESGYSMGQGGGQMYSRGSGGYSRYSQRNSRNGLQ